MAVNVEREPVVCAIQDDPMAMRRPAPSIADPAPLGPAALALTTLVKIGGWFGIATAAAGLYATFAALINSTYERTLLPLRAVRHVH